jgi:hypothetical protein
MEAEQSYEFSTCALYHHDPRAFQEFVHAYSEIVQLAVQETVAGTDRQVFAKLRTLAQRAGSQDAVPQDLIAVHLSALAALVESKPPALVRACIRQSRLLLVKMIGELALYYRDQAHASR